MDSELKKQLTGSYCVCHGPSYDEIYDLVKNMPSIKKIEDIQRYIDCGTRCRLCDSDLKKIIDFLRN